MAKWGLGWTIKTDEPPALSIGEKPALDRLMKAHGHGDMKWGLRPLSALAQALEALAVEIEAIKGKRNG